MGIEEQYVGFHPMPHKEHCPLTHPADVVDGLPKLCAAAAKTSSDKRDEVQQPSNG